MVLSTFITGILLVIDVNIWTNGQRRLFFANGCFARVDTGIPTDFTIHGLEYIPNKFSLDPRIPNNFSLIATIPNVSLHTNIPNEFAIKGIPHNISVHTNIPNSFAVDVKFPKNIDINIILPDWIQPVAVAFKYLLYAIAGSIVVLVITTSCTFIFVPRMRILRTLICGCFLTLAACFKDLGNPQHHKPIKCQIKNGGNKGAAVPTHIQPHLVNAEKMPNIYDKIM